MLVYGDHHEIADPRERLDGLRERLSVADRSKGFDRHARLVNALIEAGRLAQGLADAEAAEADQLNIFTYRLARCVVRSFDSGSVDAGSLPTVPHCDAAEPVELRVPEGFAFYAVYPEAYVVAARKLRLSAPPRIIGIRSIGTTLGAVVAAALDAEPPVTVRPFGDPFERQVELPPELIGDNFHYVIVDEGPGLSGSSFGAVADWLEERGVPLERIAFLPSHDGEPGVQASEGHRERWRRSQRVAAEFDPGFLAQRFGALKEYSTGHPWERRKYLARQGSAAVLLKFAGLGAMGERKLEIARALHSAGFTPEPLGLVHGFLVERWREDARPLGAGERPVEEIGRYIGARSRLLAASKASGATVGQLLAMSRRNVGLALGREVPEWWDAAGLEKRVRRMRTDNKLDGEEWLRTGDGRLLKCDALDHHEGHDLIGCQDAAWDVAGAISEFDLTDSEIEGLIAATRQPIDRELLRFYRLAYLSFRLGAAVVAAETASGEAAIRLVGDAERYRRQLRHLLEHGCGEIRRDSSLD